MSESPMSAVALPKNLAVIVRLPEERYRQVAEAATAEDRSMSSFVRRAVIKQLEEVGRS